MRISLIGPAYPFRGGIAHYTTLLCRHLRARHEVRFISFKRQYPKLLFPGRSDRDPSDRPFAAADVERVIDSINPATWRRAARLAIERRPEVVIIPWWVSFWAPHFWTIATMVRRRSDARVLFLCHNVREHEVSRLGRWMTERVLRLGHVFVVHSEEERAALAALVPDARIRVNPHPTYAAFNAGSADPDRVRRQLPLRGKVILFFGFVRPYKGLEHAIRALPEVLRRVECTLLVVGEFWKDRERYVSLVDELGVGDHVVLVDRYVPNEEVGDYFAAADLVVQPYVAATGSGVVQLAFGFEKPVVATTVGALAEVVEDGKTGFLVPPASPHLLAEAIARFFEHHKAGEFQANIAAANDRFSWERMVTTIEELARPGT